MRLVATATLLASANAVSLQNRAEVSANPIRRIVTLLQDMKKEIEADAKKEEELYKQFMCYCKTNDGQLGKDAQVAEETMNSNNAAAADKTGQKEQLIEELKQHKLDREEAKTLLADAIAQRKKEKEIYDKASGETKKYIDGTKKAIDALSRGAAGKMPRDPNAFIQANASAMKQIVAAASIDSDDAQTMMSFLQGDYHTVGGEIIGILKNMLDEFDKSLGGIVSAEEAAIKSFLAIKAAKEGEIELATQSIEAKSEKKGQLAVEIVQHQAAADTAEKEMGDAAAFIANLKESCAKKTADWDARTKARADELSAIQDAIDVLNDDDALDIFKSAVKPKEAASFLQRGTKKNVQARVATMLRGVKSSGVVSLLAQAAANQLKSGQKVDFTKIIVMIDEMVALLKKEQTSDENTQTWCQEELRTNEAARKETTTQIAALASEIESLTANIATQNGVIEEQTQAVADLDKSVAEQTEQRKKENEEFNALMALNQSAIQLIEKAKNKLNRFYNPGQYKAPEERELTEEERLLQGAGQDIGDTTATTQIAGTEQTTTVFLNAPSLPPAPETYGEHKAKGQKSNSVIALLSLMQNDLKSETQAAEHEEKTATENYEKFMEEAAAQRAAAMEAVAGAQAAIAEAEEAKNAATESHATKETQLVALKEENENLNQQCTFILENFEERREMRTREIDGLVTAKSVLSGANFQL